MPLTRRPGLRLGLPMNRETAKDDLGSRLHLKCNHLDMSDNCTAKEMARERTRLQEQGKARRREYTKELRKELTIWDFDKVLSYIRAVGVYERLMNIETAINWARSDLLFDHNATYEETNEAFGRGGDVVILD